jgi:hypothetical protein
MEFAALTVRDIKWGRPWQVFIYLQLQKKILKKFITLLFI